MSLQMPKSTKKKQKNDLWEFLKYILVNSNISHRNFCHFEKNDSYLKFAPTSVLDSEPIQITALASQTMLHTEWSC